MNQREFPIGNKELKKLRMFACQINWVATQARPDLLLDSCELASSFKNATVADIIKANKLLKKMKEAVLVKLQKLNEHQTVIAYHDASYTNLKDGSQGGYVVLVTDRREKYFSHSLAVLKLVSG